MSDQELLKKFLSIHPFFELFRDEQDIKRVRCKVTGHELPARLSDLESYTKGKKYQRLIKDTPSEFSGFEEYKEFLVPSSKNRKQLYCILTKKGINNSPFHIQKHVTGKRFTRALVKDREEQAKVIARGEKSDENMCVPSDLDSQSEIKDENGTKMEEDVGNSDRELTSEGRKEQAKPIANGQKPDEDMWVPSDLESESQRKKDGGSSKIEKDLGNSGGELLSEEEEDTCKGNDQRATKRKLEAKKKKVKKSSKKLRAGVGGKTEMVKRSKKRKN